MTFGVDAKGGQLNNTPSVSIRGAGTIGKGSTGSPLILIDGVEGNMNLLNPLDIESISVLKDASASSIYGSRAPFGVIFNKNYLSYYHSFPYSYERTFNTSQSADERERTIPLK